ncbi:hypothetical protein RclHR1_00850016 [Rhizophagus clarus]|uniref:Crinkler effector protein N-terminal domain-containing protein n=1 Tax=Rhizophagus clarus TaxID=94130 RepID=A0A2Z6SC12_9GLOM|nr:hypothetical protein RclHR1_00850016 [Rhizophagus clarus]
MVTSFNCYVLGDSYDTFSINIYNEKSGRYIVLDNIKYDLNTFKVGNIKDFICHSIGVSIICKMKFWKINIKKKEINVSTEEDIVQKLHGEEMELEEPFEVYFQDELGNKNFIASNIHIIVQPPSPITIGKRKKVKIERQEEDKDVKLSYTPRQRGIGGTMFLTTEGDRVGNYEGIDLNSPDICSREQTIQKLVKKIYKAGFLLVRSPPMSGKTSLGQLLEQHLVKDSDIRVIRISCLWMGNPSGSWTYEEEFQRLMGITWEKFHEECFHIKTIFIIDGVQMLYVPSGEPMSASRHNGNVFWETIKRCQQVGNLFIVAFAAYGYKGAWDYSSTTCTIDVSPFAISSENMWGIEDVRFTKDEYKDYFLRFCRTHLGKIKDENDVKYLQKYVYNTTDGHPGLVAFFMNNIKNHFFPQLKYDDTLTFERIFLYLKSYRFMNAVNNRRWGSTVRPTIPPQDFKSFLRSTFTKMNAETIRNSYSVGKDRRPLERAWQIEFYRAATQVLPPDAFISPDVGTHWGSKGYLDFFVHDGWNWAIEDICKEWAIIDIRCPDLRSDEPEYSDRHWINVYFQENWKSVIIDDKDEKVEVELTGEYS